jgi:hypothetical protein
MNQKSKEDYQKNKEHYNEINKMWAKEHVEEVKIIKKKSKLKQKEKHGTITCNCGSVVKNFTWDINRHELTKKHQNYLTCLYNPCSLTNFDA